MVSDQVVSGEVGGCVNSCPHEAGGCINSCPYEVGGCVNSCLREVGGCVNSCPHGVGGCVIKCPIYVMKNVGVITSIIIMLAPYVLACDFDLSCHHFFLKPFSIYCLPDYFRVPGFSELSWVITAISGCQWYVPHCCYLLPTGLVFRGHSQLFTFTYLYKVY